jgi:hypothetical protein
MRPLCSHCVNDNGEARREICVQLRQRRDVTLCRSLPMKKLVLLASHAVVMAVGVAFGVALGMYMLPILVAPASPSSAELTAQAALARYSGEFKRNLKDSDWLHWGEGKLRVGPSSIALEGALAPGPDYKLYLSPEFVETEADFHKLKPRMLRVGDVNTFKHFIVPMPASVDPAQFNTVVVWCEAFGQFITAAKYAPVR